MAEPPEFTAYADEMQWRGIYRDWALAGWTASRLQAPSEAASLAEDLCDHFAPETVAARIRSLAGERKDGHG